MLLSQSAGRQAGEIKRLLLIHKEQLQEKQKLQLKKKKKMERNCFEGKIGFGTRSYRMLYKLYRMKPTKMYVCK